jgi:hypothetical protein
MDETSFVDNQWPQNRYKKKLVDRKKPFVHRFQFQSFSVGPITIGSDGLKFGTKMKLARHYVK